MIQVGSRVHACDGSGMGTYKGRHAHRSVSGLDHETAVAKVQRADTFVTPVPRRYRVLRLVRVPRADTSVTPVEERSRVSRLVKV